MPKEITVATSWKELNKWQLEEIVDLYLNLKEENYKQTLKNFVIILFQKKLGFWNRLKYRKMLRNVPMSALYPYVEFLLKSPNIYSFPEITGLKKPADKLTDLTIKQYGIMDQFFHAWMTSKSDNFLKALVSSIYRIDANFEEENISFISKKIEGLTKKERQVIGFIYMSCNHFIGDSFEVVFPKPKKEKDEEKKAIKPKKHRPFSEVVINVAMNEQQPLGNLHESNKTRIYDFMNVLTKIIIQQEKLKKEYDKQK